MPFIMTIIYQIRLLETSINTFLIPLCPIFYIRVALYLYHGRIV